MIWTVTQEDPFHNYHSQPTVSSPPSSPVSDQASHRNHRRLHTSESSAPSSPFHHHPKHRQGSSETDSSTQYSHSRLMPESGDLSPSVDIGMLWMRSPTARPRPSSLSPTQSKSISQPHPSPISTKGHHHRPEPAPESLSSTSHQSTQQLYNQSLRKGNGPKTVRPPRGTPKGPLPIQDQICLLKSVLRHDPFNCPIRRTSQVWEVIGREQGIRARTCARRFDNIIQASISERQLQSSGSSGVVGEGTSPLRTVGNVKATEEQIATKNSLLEQLFTMMNQPQALIRMQKKKRYRSEDADRRLLKEIIRLNPFGQKLGQVVKTWEDVRDALGMKVHSRQCIRRVNRMIKPYQVRDRMYNGSIPVAMREENDDLIKEVIDLMKMAGQPSPEGEEEEEEGEEEEDGGSGIGGPDEEDDSMTASASDYYDQDEGSVHAQSPPVFHQIQEESGDDRKLQCFKTADTTILAGNGHSSPQHQHRSPSTWTLQSPRENINNYPSPPRSSELALTPRQPRSPKHDPRRDMQIRPARSPEPRHPYAKTTGPTSDWPPSRHSTILHWSHSRSERPPNSDLDQIFQEIRAIQTCLGRIDSEQQRDRDQHRSMSATMTQLREQLDQQQRQIQTLQHQLQHSQQQYHYPEPSYRHHSAGNAFSKAQEPPKFSSAYLESRHHDRSF